MKKRNGKKHLYLRSVLDELQASTGYTFVAVCSGGAAMAHPCGGAASFAEMLEHVPRGVRFVVSIVCGNDYYGHRVHPITPAMEIAIAEYCARVEKLAFVHLAVAGMPSDVWGYKTWMSADSWRQ